MGEGDDKPGQRLGRNLERLYGGVTGALGWAVQPLAWLAETLSIDARRRAKAWLWLRQNYHWVVMVVGGGLFLIFAVSALWQIRGAVFGSIALLQAELSGGGDADRVRGFAYTIGALLAGIALIAAIPFQLIKTWVNERNTTATEQGHITDRFTRAVEQLGAEKTVKRDGVESTEPNIEVRLGAIYALERIAQDSERDHIPIMETLCAYIRENANREPVRDFPLGDLPERKKDAEHATPELRMALIRARARNTRDFFGPAKPLRADIQAVFAVIARRTERQKQVEREATPPFRLDFRLANLQGLDLSDIDIQGANLHRARLEATRMVNANLANADLGGARLEGAVISRAKLERSILRGANLFGAEMEGVKLNEADLRAFHCEGAKLTSAELKGADLATAWMEGAGLANAQMEGAVLSLAGLEGANLNGARLERAVLIEAHLEAADLSRTQLNSADLRDWSCVRTSLRSAEFTGAKHLSADSLESAFGVRSDIGRTILPDGMPYPDHWHVAADVTENGPEDQRAYQAAYSAWLATLPPDA